MAESAGSGTWEYVRDTVKSSWHVLQTKFHMLWPLALLSFIPSALSSLLQDPKSADEISARFDNLDDRTSLSSVISSVFGVSIGELVFAAILVVAVLTVYNVFVQGAGIRSLLDLWKRPETKIDFNSIMTAGKRHFSQVFVAGVAVVAIVVVGIFLLVIPGVIAAILLSFTFHAVIDKGLGTSDAMRMSYEIVKKNIGKFLLLGLMYFLVAIVAAIALSILNAILPQRLELLVEDAYSAVFGLLVLIGGTKFYLDHRPTSAATHQAVEHN